MSDDQPRKSVKELAGRFNNMSQQQQQQQQQQKPPVATSRRSETFSKPPDLIPRNSENLQNRASIQECVSALRQEEAPDTSSLEKQPSAANNDTQFQSSKFVFEKEELKAQINMLKAKLMRYEQEEKQTLHIENRKNELEQQVSAKNQEILILQTKYGHHIDNRITAIEQETASQYLQKIEVLTQKQETQEAELSASRAKIASLQQSLHQLKEELQSKEKLIQDEQSAQLKEISDLGKERIKLIAEVHKVQAELKEEKEKNATQFSQIQALTNKATQIQNLSKMEIDKLSLVAQQLEDSKSELQLQYERLQEQHSALQVELDLSKQSVCSIQGELNELRTNFENQNSQFQESKAELLLTLEIQKDEVIQQKKENQVLHEKLTQLNIEINKKIQQYQKELKHQEDEVSAKLLLLREEKLQTDAENRRLIETHNLELNQLKTQLQSKCTEASILSNQLNEQQKLNAQDIEESTRILQENSDRCQQLTRQLQELAETSKTQLSSKEAAFNQLMQEKDQQLAALTSQLGVKELEYIKSMEELTLLLEQKTKSCAQLQEQLEAMQVASKSELGEKEAELARVVTQKEELIARFKEQVSKQSQELQVKQAEFKAFEESHAEKENRLVGETQQLGQQIKILQAQLKGKEDELLKSIEESKTLIEQNNRQCKALSEQLNAFQSESKSRLLEREAFFSSALQEKDIVIANQKEQAAAKEIELKSLKLRHDNEVEILKNQCAQLGEQLQGLEEQGRSQLREEEMKSVSLAQEKQNEIKSLKEQIAAKDRELKSSQEENERLKQSCNESGSRLVEKDLEIAALSKQFAEQQQKLLKDTSELQNTLKLEMGKYKVLQEQFQALQSISQSQQEQKDQLISKITELKDAEIAQLKEMLIKKEVDLNNSLEEQKKLLQQNNENCKILSEQMKSLQLDSVQRISEKEAQLTDMNQKKDGQINALQVRIKELEQVHQKLVQQKDAEIDTLKQNAAVNESRLTKSIEEQKSLLLDNNEQCRLLTEQLKAAQADSNFQLQERETQFTMHEQKKDQEIVALKQQIASLEQSWALRYEEKERQLEANAKQMIVKEETTSKVIEELKQLNQQSTQQIQVLQTQLSQLETETQQQLRQKDSELVKLSNKAEQEMAILQEELRLCQKRLEESQKAQFYQQEQQTRESENLKQLLEELNKKAGEREIQFGNEITKKAEENNILVAKLAKCEDLLRKKELEFLAEAERKQGEINLLSQEFEILKLENHKSMIAVSASLKEAQNQKDQQLESFRLEMETSKKLCDQLMQEVALLRESLVQNDQSSQEERHKFAHEAESHRLQIQKLSQDLQEIQQSLKSSQLNELRLQQQMTECSGRMQALMQEKSELELIKNQSELDFNEQLLTEKQFQQKLKQELAANQEMVAESKCELAKVRAENESLSAALENQKNSFQKQVTEFKSLTAKLESEAHEQKIVQESLESELASMQAQQLQLQQEIELAKQDAAAQRQANEEVILKNQQTFQEISEQNSQKASSLNLQIATFQDQLATALAVAEKAHQDSQAKITNLTQRLETECEIKKSLASELESVNSEFKQLREQFEEQNVLFHTTKSNLNLCFGQNAVLTQQVSEHIQKLDEGNRTLSQLRNTIDQLQTEMQIQQSEKATLTQQVKTQSEKIQELSQQLSTSTAATQQLNSELAELRQSQKSLQKDHGTLQGQYAQLKQQAQKYQDYIRAQQLELEKPQIVNHTIVLSDRQGELLEEGLKLVKQKVISGLNAIQQQIQVNKAGVKTIVAQQIIECNKEFVRAFEKVSIIIKGTDDVRFVKGPKNADVLNAEIQKMKDFIAKFSVSIQNS